MHAETNLFIGYGFRAFILPRLAINRSFAHRISSIEITSCLSLFRISPVYITEILRDKIITLSDKRTF